MSPSSPSTARILLDRFVAWHRLTPPERADVETALAGLHPGAEHDPERAAELLARVWWSFLVEPGDGVAGALIAEAGAVAALLAVLAALPTPDALPDMTPAASIRGTLPGVPTPDATRALARWRPRVGDRGLVGALRSAASLHLRVLLPGDDAWPRRVADLGEHGPVCLWTLGRAELLDRPRVGALVGSRAATPYGLQVTADIAEAWCRQGFTVLSGGAYGVDRQAHRTALAVGGDTVAVLAGGLDRLYPAGNEPLLREIAERGCLVAEQPPGTAPTRWRFLQRNRLIASLAAVVVVTEAGHRSGALNTARHAAQLGRPIGAVPGSVVSGSSAGANRIIRDGIAQLVATGDEALGMLALQPELEPSPVAGLRAELVRLHDALHPRQPAPTAALAARAGLAETTVSAGLGELELLGLAVRAGDGRWRRG